MRPLKHLDANHARRQGRHQKDSAEPRTVARADTTFLVTNMMRSVLNEGTAAGARGQRLHARCGGQDRHDQRPARRVVRRLHARSCPTVVWVGFDDNQPVGLSGSRAALPIWTQFMHTALAGRASLPFDVPEWHHASWTSTR